MIVKNLTGNSIYDSLLDLYIPYYPDLRDQYLAIDNVKKSSLLEQVIRSGKISISKIDKSCHFSNVLFDHQSRKAADITTAASGEEMINSQKPNVLTVLIRGHFEEQGGYAKVNRNLAYGLEKNNVKVHIDALGNNSHLIGDDKTKLNRLKTKPDPYHILIDSVIPSFGDTKNAKYKILYTTVESKTIPQQFIDSINNYNEVWVVSDFSKEVLKNHGITKDIYVVPCSVDTIAYTPHGSHCVFSKDVHDFKFLSVFGWGWRKGYDVLLKSYLQEFSSDDRVSLVIMSRMHNNEKHSSKIVSEIKEFVNKYRPENPPHIVHSPAVISESMMPSVYRSCDAFVLFSRGEAFCIPYVEASLCGLPVIGTNCSGQTMFLNKDNSSIVDVDRYDVVRPGTSNIHYWDNQLFPVLNSDSFIVDARNAMRNVYSEYSVYKSKNKKLQKLISKEYAIDKVSSIAHARLFDIWRQL